MAPAGMPAVLGQPGLQRFVLALLWEPHNTLNYNISSSPGKKNRQISPSRGVHEEENHRGSENGLYGL